MQNIWQDKAFWQTYDLYLFVEYCTDFWDSWPLRILYIIAGGLYIHLSKT
jgi:hypothetical protein